MWPGYGNPTICLVGVSRVYICAGAASVVVPDLVDLPGLRVDHHDGHIVEGSVSGDGRERDGPEREELAPLGTKRTMTGSGSNWMTSLAISIASSSLISVSREGRSSPRRRR